MSGRFRSSPAWIMGRRFARADGGNTMVTFAIALIPLIGLTGAAVDYGNANLLRSAMQVAADSTALAVAQDATGQTADQLQSSAGTFFNALYTKTGADNLRLSATYSSANGSTVTVTATATMKTNFMGVLGISEVPLSVTSQATWGTSRLRVALALDNTGSMSSSGKMTALKTASKSLLNQLKGAAANAGDVYVSIIPFSKDVNVDSGNSSANWIDWLDWNASNGTCSVTGKHHRTFNTQSECQSAGGKWTAAAHSTWNGCITDRDKDYDISNTTPNPADASLPAGTASSLFPAEDYAYCPVELMGLSYNWTALNSKIDAMFPNGNTNQGIGLAWAWQSLTQGAPLSAPAEDPDYKYQKVIILLSDGLNTQNRWTTSASAIDTRQRLMCDKIKAAGITIYTVQVNTGGDPTSAVLKYCASDPSKFFLLKSANAMVTAFNQIGTAISKLRIAK